VTFHCPWPFSESLPFGYYQLSLQIGSRRQTSGLISAPERLKKNSGRSWGLFSPLYALKSDNDWGIGDLRDLAQAQKFLRREGGQFFGVLPMLAMQTNSKKFDPSPYCPSSRLFWNEIYLNISEIASQMEVSCPHACESSLHTMKQASYVDYETVYKQKKSALTILSDQFFSKGFDRHQDYLAFLQEKPDVEAYARFRGETKFHLFVQYQLHRQLLANQNLAQKNEIAHLYLDYPVGVSPLGFDTHQYPDVFLKEATIGAPPDTFFQEGQNWGTAPLHPQNIQKNGHEYFIRSLRNHFRYASLLRLDHVMSLHRLYVIPPGNSAKEGTYIKFPSEELYGILCLEAHRSQAEVIGEDLGTVPSIVREKMTEHHVQRMWIFELEYARPPQKEFQHISSHSLAALNTHDMDPFFKFWDLEDANKKKFLQEWLRFLEIHPTENLDKRMVMTTLMEKLAASPAHIFLMNLEDLWGETEPQNIPGISNEKTWRKKDRLSMEEWMSSEDIQNLLRKVREVRQHG
jgi:4-alpha-glucanotransferase